MEHIPGPDQPLDFDDFANQLLAEGAEQSPAYLHGGICGVYAAAGPVQPEDCVAAASQALELGLHGELGESCLRLADITLRAMQDEEFDFHLFLPDDETEIEQRVQTLAEWCRGFLSGFALMITEDANLDGDSGESLKDLAAIAEATVDAESDEEESESHFFELTEYLRFATLNLFMEQLERLQSAEGGDPSA